MSVLVLKVVLTPLFIAGASLAQRRWGSAVAGLLVGLPLTSGPVSVFLALLTATAVAALRPMKVHAPGQAVDSAG